MIALYLIYCTFLIVYCGFFILITMASSHQFVSTEYIYLTVLGSSTCSFFATIIFIVKKLFVQQEVKGKTLQWLVAINILFFIYYSYSLLYQVSEVDYINYSPLLGVILSLLVLLSISFRKKSALSP